MSQTYYAILTAVGEAKLANATALGTQLQISKMAVGDGNGNLPTPNRSQTALVNERYRANLNNLMVDPKNASQIIAELIIPETEGGYWLREMALFDAAGDMVAVSNCPPSYKPQMSEGSGRTQVLRMVLVVSSADAVQLKIDPSVVLATREYVDSSLLAALNKQDYKHSVLVATTGAIPLNGLQTIDDVVLVAGSRVLVKDQAAAKDNGLYLAAAGSWSRTADADVSEEVTPGLFVHIERGTANGDSVWQLVTDAPITLGTTPLTFEIVAGRTGVSAGTYTKITVDKNGRVLGGTTPTTLATLGILDAYTKAQVDALIAQASSLPVGSILPMPKAAVPPGFLELDGSVQSIATYPDLSAYLGTAYNKGDEGAGFFRLPDSRGEFLRGWDHGRGIDAGRVLGSWQNFEVQEHDHTTNNTANAGSDPTLWVYGDAGSGPITPPSVRTNKTGGVETRPRNLAVMWCIKAWNAPVNQGQIDVAALAVLAGQATETKLGTAKIATQDQVDTGADDATFITPKKFKFGITIIKGASSWGVEFPRWLGLLKLQWGVHSAQTSDGETSVTFPIGFDAVPACISMLTHEGDTTAQSTAVTQGRKVTTTGFLSRREDIGSVSTFSGAVSIRWFAIGF